MSKYVFVMYGNTYDSVEEVREAIEQRVWETYDDGEERSNEEYERITERSKQLQEDEVMIIKRENIDKFLEICEEDPDEFPEELIEYNGLEEYEKANPDTKTYEEYKHWTKYIHEESKEPVSAQHEGNIVKTDTNAITEHNDTKEGGNNMKTEISWSEKEGLHCPGVFKEIIFGKENIVTFNSEEELSKAIDFALMNLNDPDYEIVRIGDIENNEPVKSSNTAAALNTKGGSHMFEILKLNLATKTIATIPYPSTVALEWAEARGRADNAFLIVDHSFDKKKLPNAQKNLEYILKNGFRYNSVKYVWVMAGSSQLRKASSTFIDETLKDEFLRFILCGVDDRKNLVANKTLVYRALSMSSTYSWYSKLPESEYFGLMKMPDIDKIGIFRDVEVDYEGVFDVVEENETLFGQRRTVQYKISDGVAYYVVDDTKLNNKQRMELLKQLEAFTFRAPGFKGLMIPILKSVLLNWIRFNKINPIVKDYWGNEVDIRELEVITFSSVFKWCKCVDNFEGYRRAFKELGHEFRVCVTAHHRKADIPYQQMQTLQLTAEDARLLAAAGTAKMQKLSTLDGAHKLLSGAMKDAVKLYPSLLKNKYIFDQANACYLSRYWNIAGGRVPEVSQNPFAAPDTVAVLQGLFGLKPEGVIEGKHVYCSIFKEGKTVDVTRCPHLDNAHCLRKVDLPEDTMIGFFMGSACYFSCHDSTMSNVQMDFDGDHVNVTDNEFIVEKAKESIARLGNRPLYYEAKGSKASYATDEDIVNLLLNIEPAPVGLYANTLTKIYANGVHGTRDLDRIAVATEGANTCIDAAKYISGDSVEAAGFRGLRLIDQFNGVKLPMYHAYAKSSPFVKGSFEARLEKSDFYANCGLDAYNKTFVENTSDKLVVNGLGELEFDYSVLMSAPCRVVPGLVNVIDSSNKQGIFRDLAREFDVELAEVRSTTAGMDDVDKDARIDAFSLARCADIREQILAYAASVGSDLANTVNYLVRYLFTVKFCPDSMMMLLWSCFGEEIVANIRNNLSR